MMGLDEFAERYPEESEHVLTQATNTAVTETADEVYRTCGALFDAAVADGLLNPSSLSSPADCAVSVIPS